MPFDPHIDFSFQARQLASFRNSRNLTVLDLAAILKVHPSTIESWESAAAKRQCKFSLADMEDRLKKYLLEYGVLPKNPNALFGNFEVVVFRKIENLEIKEAALMFGHTIAQWKKFESNRRIMPSSTRVKLEQLLSKKFECSLSSSQTSSESYPQV